MRGSIKQRLELLAGLIDTDGTVCNGERDGWKDYRVSFSNTNERLIEQVQELISGLGMWPSKTRIEPALSSSGIQGRKAVYQIGFTPIIDIPTQVSRKKIKVITKRKRLTIREIKTVKPELGRCITVDSEDGIYLVGKELIPTHNSLTIALAVLTRVATFPEKLAIVAPSLTKARIIMGYIIDHAFDNPFTASRLEIAKDESEQRLRRERSKNRLTFRQSDGSIGEVFVVSGDSKNTQAAGESLMGLGCLGGEEEIITEKGVFKIRDLVRNKNATKCLSFNHATGSSEFKEILSFQENQTVERYMLEIDFGDRKIVCTNDHPVFIEGKGYVLAEEVEAGDYGLRVA